MIKTYRARTNNYRLLSCGGETKKRAKGHCRNRAIPGKGRAPIVAFLDREALVRRFEVVPNRLHGVAPDHSKKREHRAFLLTALLTVGCGHSISYDIPKITFDETLHRLCVSVQRSPSRPVEKYCAPTGRKK